MERQESKTAAFLAAYGSTVDVPSILPEVAYLMPTQPLRFPTPGKRQKYAKRKRLAK